MASEKRLIDANHLWRYARAELDKANKRHSGEPDFQAWSSGVAELICALAKDMPTVDAVEVVHGRWIGEVGGYMWRQNCSVCNGPVYNKMKPYYNYCPNCGAKMDGGNEDG